MVHGGCSARKFDIELVVAIGGRRVGAAADAACAEVELDRVVDHVETFTPESETAVLLEASSFRSYL